MRCHFCGIELLYRLVFHLYQLSLTLGSMKEYSQEPPLQMTFRMSGLSMPIPNALVATMTWISPDFHDSCLEATSISPWYPTACSTISSRLLTNGPMSAMKSVYMMVEAVPAISAALTANCIAGATLLSGSSSSAFSVILGRLMEAFRTIGFLSGCRILSSTSSVAVVESAIIGTSPKV